MARLTRGGPFPPRSQPNLKKSCAQKIIAIESLAKSAFVWYPHTEKIHCKYCHDYQSTDPIQ
ncbi:hypothetical protein EST62_11785 [Chlorobaculum sp. 24CR]|nr:hypothetical protein EST62_11785 [Chlorobaculum sp. 24CR]